MIKTLLINGECLSMHVNVQWLTADRYPGLKVKLQIWDTAGQERFRSITQSYYRSAHALILVYDISSQPSYDSCPQWVRDVEQYAGSGGSSSKHVLKVLVGNKCDKERDIPVHIAESYAKNNGFDIFMETSALEAENVEKLFYDIAEQLVHQSESESGISTGQASGSHTLNEDNDKESRPCVACHFN